MTKPKTPKAKTRPKVKKVDRIIALISRPGGATRDDLVKATGWSPTSVRAFVSRNIKADRGLNVVRDGDAYSIFDGEAI